MSLFSVYQLFGSSHFAMSVLIFEEFICKTVEITAKRVVPIDSVYPPKRFITA